MNKTESSLCSYCKQFDETIPHLFYECHKTKSLWNELKSAFLNLSFPNLTLRSAFLGFYHLNDALVNQIHLIFRISLYSQRENGFCNIDYLRVRIKSIREIEESLTFLSPHASSFNIRKWARVGGVQRG